MRYAHWLPMMMVSAMAAAGQAEPLSGRWEGAIRIAGILDATRR